MNQADRLESLPYIHLCRCRQNQTASWHIRRSQAPSRPSPGRRQAPSRQNSRKKGRHPGHAGPATLAHLRRPLSSMGEPGPGRVPGLRPAATGLPSLHRSCIEWRPPAAACVSLPRRSGAQSPQGICPPPPLQVCKPGRAAGRQPCREPEGAQGGPAPGRHSICPLHCATRFGYQPGLWLVYIEIKGGNVPAEFPLYSR